jgi:hypothetical protein
MNHRDSQAFINKGGLMTYHNRTEKARERFEKCRQSVQEQRRRLVDLEDRNSDTWLAKCLLAASEATLRAQREHLVMLTGRASGED